jgi:hypothetical protein
VWLNPGQSPVANAADLTARRACMLGSNSCAGRAQALSTTQVYVDNYTSEATAAPFVLHLLPGQHQLEGAGGGSVTFTVNPDGTVSFPASEDGLLYLQGQADLIVEALS